MPTSQEQTWEPMTGSRPSADLFPWKLRIERNPDGAGQEPQWFERLAEKASNVTASVPFHAFCLTLVGVYSERWAEHAVQRELDAIAIAIAAALLEQQREGRRQWHGGVGEVGE